MERVRAGMFDMIAWGRGCLGDLCAKFRPSEELKGDVVDNGAYVVE